MSYSWGSDTSTSYRGGGYSYSSARNAYDVGKAYVKPKKKKAAKKKKIGKKPTKKKKTKTAKKTQDMFGINPNKYPNVPNKISTDSKNPLVMALDITGSMGKGAVIIAKKMPLLYNEVVRYLPDVEISFAAIGDADGGGLKYDGWSSEKTKPDKHPLQIREFAAGPDLEEKIRSITRKAAGGNNGYESFELGAHFYANRCEMPNAERKPLLFFTGDDMFCNILKKKNVRKVLKEEIPYDLSSFDTFNKLKDQYEVYFIQSDRGYKRDQEIKNQWTAALGEEKVITLKKPERIVDCVVGIVADYVDKFDDFTKRLTQRQTKQQVKQVMDSIMVSRSQQYDKSGNYQTAKSLPIGKTNKS